MSVSKLLYAQCSIHNIISYYSTHNTYISLKYTNKEMGLNYTVVILTFALPPDPPSHSLQRLQNEEIPGEKL